nr:hypothetical protein [uncultured Rhodoferax sp.]
MKSAIYSTKSTREVASFLDAVSPQLNDGAGGQAVLDSVRNMPGVTIPKGLDELLGNMKSSDESRILDSVQAGLTHYQKEHGCMPTADVVEAAIQQGQSAFRGIDTRGQILDSATSSHHDQLSLQPNRAVVAILSAIAEAIPFASYLPVDIQSNQSKLAILSHVAGSAYGDYLVNGIMDGTSAGDVYTSSSRIAKIDTSGALPWAGKFSQSNAVATPGYSDNAGTGVPVLRGRTIVFIKGVPVGMEPTSGNAGASPISGSATIGGIDYTVTGTITVATGVLAITGCTASSGGIVNLPVTAQGFVDYEASPALIPKVLVRADIYDIYANPWRVMTGISIDAVGQFRNELGIDANSEALLAIRTQMAMERHYQALRMASQLAINNVTAYDFQYSTQIAQKTRANILQDMAPVLANADQKMAIDTMDHGITQLYVPAFFANMCNSLGSDLFKSSGISARPGIYRVGRLFDKYEVYYSPKVVSQNAGLTTASILGVGRSAQVARCPIVLGDAVAPTFLPLNMQTDLVNNAAMYARDFTVVNPHTPSAMGCAQINVTNLS